VKKSLQTDFHARHPVESGVQFVYLIGLMDQKKVMDSGVRGNDDLGDVYPLIDSF